MGSLAWFTFGHAPQNSRLFLASDWSSSFHAFTDKLLIRLSSNWVGQLIICLPQPDLLLVMLHEIHTISWPLISWVVSVHLQTNCWSHWAQMWWTNSLWAFLSLINFWSHSTEFQPFPVLWLVKNSIHLQTNCWSGWAQIWWTNSSPHVGLLSLKNIGQF